MWSTDFSGRYSAFSPQERLLFPVRDSGDSTKKCLVRTLLQGTCTGVALLRPEDRGAALLVRQALQTVCTKNPQLHRTNFTIVVTTSTAWSAETLSDRVHDLVASLQLETLDVLLLARPAALTAASTTLSTAQRKRLVLSHWDAMCSLQQRGLVRAIGVSDFTVQEMEFMFTATPSTPPTVLSLGATVAPTRSAASRPSTTPVMSIRAMVSFAHGWQMDMVVRFAYRTLDEPAPTQLTWRQTVHTIAERQRARHFEVPVVHEAEQDAYHLEKRDMAETTTLQTSTQIVVRYLLQKGIVVVPLPDSDDIGDQFTDDESHELFYELMHPFTSLPPTRSPQVQYSSVLSKDELQLIDQALPFVVAVTDEENTAE